MDELDLTEKTPRAFDDDHPAPRAAAPPPLPRARAPRASSVMRKPTLPPPLPAAARRGSGTLIVPPLPPPAQTISLLPSPARVPDLAPAKLVPFLPPPEPMSERTPTMPRPRIVDDEPHVARAPLPSVDIDVDVDTGTDTDDDDLPIDPPRPLEYTTAAPKKSNTGLWIGAGVGASLVAGVLAVTLIGRSGPDVASTAAPPAPAPATVTAPVAAPQPETPKTEVPIRSQPAGAMVTLISAGEATVIGKTPITATLDPRKQYDVVLAYRELPTHLAHLDPERTVALDIDLMAAPPPPVPAVAVPAPAAQEQPAPEEPAEEAIATKEEAPPPPRRRTAKPKAAPPKTVAAAPAPAGSGILMVSAKPPCNIAIDGKPTRLVTPQRAIQLSAGPHKITLTNTQQRISKTISVTIDPKKPTKLIQDFTAQLANPF